MSFTDLLEDAITKNNSLLCVGLDPDLSRMPEGHRKPEDIFDFNRAIVDKTAKFVCAYKPNTAFYEAFGPVGIEQLKKTCEYVKNAGVPLIVDAKRADIGHTNKGYADFIFGYLEADAVTLNPYLGSEALAPFFEYKDKGLIILCRTSNPGSGEFQELMVDDKKLFEAVAQRVAGEWSKDNDCLLVVGATYPEELQKLRHDLGDDMTFLVPGVGAQGGEVEATVRAGINKTGKGLIVNAGRSIIYASSGRDFAEAARTEAEKLRNEINKYRKGNENG